MELHNLTVLLGLSLRSRIGRFFVKGTKPTEDQVFKDHKIRSPYFFHHSVGSGVTGRQINWSSKKIIGEEEIGIRRNLQKSLTD